MSPGIGRYALGLVAALCLASTAANASKRCASVRGPTFACTNTPLMCDTGYCSDHCQDCGGPIGNGCGYTCFGDCTSDCSFAPDWECNSDANCASRHDGGTCEATHCVVTMLDGYPRSRCVGQSSAVEICNGKDDN